MDELTAPALTLDQMHAIRTNLHLRLNALLTGADAVDCDYKEHGEVGHQAEYSKVIAQIINAIAMIDKSIKDPALNGEAGTYIVPVHLLERPCA